MKTTLAQAYAMLDACNLPGVLHSFADHVSTCRAESYTYDMQTDPVCLLYFDKIRDMLAYPKDDEIWNAVELARVASEVRTNA